jgi:hypothetical protein
MTQIEMAVFAAIVRDRNVVVAPEGVQKSSPKYRYIRKTALLLCY